MRLMRFNCCFSFNSNDDDDDGWFSFKVKCSVFFLLFFFRHLAIVPDRAHGVLKFAHQTSDRAMLLSLIITWEKKRSGHMLSRIVHHFLQCTTQSGSISLKMVLNLCASAIQSIKKKPKKNRMEKKKTI